MARKKMVGEKEGAALARRLYEQIEATMSPRKEAVLGAELQKIARERGVLRPEDVLAEAASRKDGDELHDFFVWDDAEAGRIHRLNQARALIIRAKIYFRRKEADGSESKVRVRQFPSLGMRQGFADRAVVISDAEKRAHLVRTRLRAVLSALHELVDVDELSTYRVRVRTETEEVAAQLEIEL